MARGALGVAVLTCLLASLAAPAAAADPVIGVPLPAELVAPPFMTQGQVTEAVAFDVDEHGVRELLVVTSSTAGMGIAAVQVWEVAADGTVNATNTVPLRRSASVDEQLQSRAGIDRDGMMAVRLGEPARFVIVQRDGQPVPLVATIGTPTDQDVPCCLTIWEIILDDDALDLRLVADTQRLGVELIAADMDADGTDELVVTEGPINEADNDILDLGLLRWNGDRFSRVPFSISFVAGCCSSILEAGETDGVPGEEVLLTGPGANLATGLHRVTLRDGAPFAERAEIGEIATARALDLPSGPAIVNSDGLSTLFLWSWPRDAQPHRLAVRTTGGNVAAVFGTGAETRVLVSAGTPPGSVLILPGDIGGSLGAGPSSFFGRDTRAGAFSGTALFDQNAPPLDPFYGVVPGGLPGIPDAYVFSGKMVRPSNDPDQLAEAETVALLPGLEPMGTVGPGERWMALLSGFTPPGSLGLVPTPATDLRFGRPAGVLRLAATAAVFEPEINGAHLQPTFHGVALDPGRPGVLLVGNEAVDAEIEGPVGTKVWWSSRGDAGLLTIDASRVARIRLLDAAGPNAPDGSGASVTLWLVTPAGHAYAGAWRIRVYRQPPDLGIRDEAPLVDFSPTVSGRTIPGTIVTINGQPTEVAADGSFSMPVDAGIVPTDFRIVAIDPVGNRSERVVSVVWPVDYRRLPFVPIAVLLTVAAALILYLRTPGAGPRGRTPDDDATFEEIGG